MEDFEINLDYAAKSQDTPVQVVDEAALDLAAIAKMVPDKMAFKIGDVAEIADIKPYVLRYWESEFDALNPQKSNFNQRVYSKRDVETVLLIKKLLYDEKFSIAGAKKKIRELRKELKSEKKRVEVSDKIELATNALSDMLEDIQQLKRMMAL
ncbi:MAG: MerR family transcriptional regulator [Oligoflexia bacterium]|nr:MerR family transcriptional regulator [Oligoflexia bacterium]